MSLPGRYHCCDGCSLRWHGERWPSACPDCKRGPWWIASYEFPEGAQAHRPLNAVTTGHTVTPDLPEAA